MNDAGEIQGSEVTGDRDHAPNACELFGPFMLVRRPIRESPRLNENRIDLDRIVASKQETPYRIEKR